MAFLGKLGDKISSKVHKLGSEVKEELHDQAPVNQNRYGSFAAPREGNDVKWYVDGCGYFWAVSVALERATESIWILDWWLSPELYLRRPPALHEQYRLDRMLKAAADRGVKVNVIVYKEVTQALTLSSSHTKHALEDLSPNICVFRHPDHLPDAQTLQSSLTSSFSNFKATAASISKLPGDALQALYGGYDDVILYWAHHEKLCLVDGHTAFMGGLDMCYGRWDTNQHAIADAHPANLNEIVFPGQDFNNARIMDFSDVVHWDQNKLDRTESSRMGWTDISISMHGPVVHDLRKHFVDRWNFIYNEKYDVRQDTRYSRLSMMHTSPLPPHERGDHEPRRHHMREFEARLEEDPRMQRMEERLGENRHMQHLEEKLEERFGERFNLGEDSADLSLAQGPMPCQIVRSCSKWSNGTSTEHSIQNAYISIIESAQHFVYIENQFFITATATTPKPVQNRIGAAIVARILRAARAGEKFKVMVIMPAIPAFAGDLKDEASLGTRAIMEFQYNSVNRSGHSIMEAISKEGYNPMEYIRFYNLRNYDRINVSGTMQNIEQSSGVDYELARREHDDRLDPMGYSAQGGQKYAQESAAQENSGRYQQAARDIGASSRWDSVSECYMLNGEDIRNVPWQQGSVPEIDAFVSEELYVHTKVLIADDRVVICGSANLNDRSQLGTHDSEIACVIQDPTPIDSTMDGEPYRASEFAATLRRQIFRKHLGLIPPQDMTLPDQNFEPVGTPNKYDFGSREDALVTDPLSDHFQNFWNARAHTNTEAFGRIFHPVPHDSVKNWKDYDRFYEQFFHEADEEADGKSGKKKPAKYRWGHVVRENFAEGEQGLREVKDLLSTIKGTVVEMPLLFLIEEDIAKEGLSLNAFTEDVYT
ncbi:hypothetical protein MMC25_004870 [Agyrium rufum]|nr:hypothetical protein [Agyrium rufum]